MIVYGVVLLLVSGAVLLSLWPFLFPDVERKQKAAVQKGLTRIAEVRSIWKFPGVQSPDVWGIAEEQKPEAADTSVPTLAGWQIALKEGVWNLKKDGITWFLHGTIIEREEPVAVFSSDSQPRQWKKLRKNEAFDGLSLSRISHDNISLRSDSGAETELGLYHLKYNNKEE